MYKAILRTHNLRDSYNTQAFSCICEFAAFRTLCPVPYPGISKTINYCLDGKEESQFQTVDCRQMRASRGLYQHARVQHLAFNLKVMSNFSGYGRLSASSDVSHSSQMYLPLERRPTTQPITDRGHQSSATQGTSRSNNEYRHQITQPGKPFLLFFNRETAK